MSDTDPLEMSAEQFAELVGQAGSDEEIAEGIRAVGTGQVLDRVFSEMQSRFQPERAQNADAKVQWVVRDADEEHRFAMEIANGTCSAQRGDVDDPKVTLTTDLASFAKIITGKEGGPTLFMRGKLQVSGDLFYAQRITGFFDQPA